MTFSFYSPPSLTPAQSGAIPDIIGNILSGYTDMTKAKYLKPGLEEELKKSKLYNQYYGPNIKSQIGLRGAQAGHLGSLTRGQDISNRFSPQRFMDEAQERQLKANQERIFTQMLQQKLAEESMGNQNQGMGTPQYMPGQGQVPYASYAGPEQMNYSQGNPSPFSQPTNQMSQSNTMPFDLARPPHETLNDLTNKKFFGLNTFTPRFNAYIKAATQNMGKKEAAEIQNNAKISLANMQEVEKYKSELPILDQNIERIGNLKKIIYEHPEFFGHRIGIGPFKFEKKSKNPLVGYIQTSLLPDIIAADQALKTAGSNLAINTGKEKVPTFDKGWEVAKGNIDAMYEASLNKRKLAEDRLGGHIIKRGNDNYKRLPNGKWVKLKKAK